MDSRSIVVLATKTTVSEDNNIKRTGRGKKQQNNEGEEREKNHTKSITLE